MKNISFIIVIILELVACKPKEGSNHFDIFWSDSYIVYYPNQGLISVLYINVVNNTDDTISFYLRDRYSKHTLFKLALQEDTISYSFNWGGDDEKISPKDTLKINLFCENKFFVQDLESLFRRISEQNDALSNGSLFYQENNGQLIPVQKRLNHKITIMKPPKFTRSKN